MRISRVAVVAALLMTTPMAARQDDKVVPVHQEPRHRLVFDHSVTKILDIQIPPGDTTLFHTHSDPILYVPMSSSQTRSQTLGGDWSGGASAANPATAPLSTPPRRLNSVTSYAKQPLTHRVNNIGQTLFRLIGVINASGGDASTTPSADFSATPEVDNPWFRAYRQTLTAEAGAEHRHANPIALVVIDGQVTSPGLSIVPLPPRGGYVFLEANKPHTLRASSGTAEIVEIEIRRPR